MLTKVTLKICQNLGEHLRKFFENKSPGQLKLHGHTLKSSECHVIYETRIV